MNNPSVSDSVARQNADLAARLPFHDTQDFADAERGRIGGLDPAVVTAADGRVVWDNDAYSFLEGEAPSCVNPSLWRQGTLVAMHGLYEVVEGIYQVRGLDLSNVTFVEGERGVIVIDPLISVETAAAALGLYREHRGDRPVTAVIYTHSHVDHFGGVKGVTTQDDVDAGRCVGARARRVPRRGRGRERLRGRRDVAPRRVHVRRRPPEGPGRPGRRGARHDHQHRHGLAHPPDPRHHPHRSGGGRRRRADRLPDDPRHRGAGRDELRLPRPQGRVPGREHVAHPAQPAHPARRAGARPARLVGLPHRDDRPARPTTSRSPSPRTTGRPGGASRSSSSSRCSATSTATCTTRPCG